MKQVEVTTRVFQSLNEIDKLLISKGFKLIRKSRIEDIYFTHDYNETNNDIFEVLKKSVLVRYLCVDNNKEFKKITYKNKAYKDNIVISEEKISVNIDSIENAEKLLNALDFKKLINVNYDVIVYKNDIVEFAFQDVENLGLLLEYENSNDFDGYSDEEILNEKKNMLETIKKYGISISDEFDVKKAYELLKKEESNYGRYS